MFIQSLSGNWDFRQFETTEWLPATVPGGVHTDLLALGKIPDPFVGDNEKSVQWITDVDWEYRCLFTADTQLTTEQHVLLVCDGLDTLADLYLNGEYLGHTDNMFRQWEFDVKNLLRPGKNELLIHFGAPVAFIRGKQAQLPLQGGGDIPGGPHLRKAPCHWGWDWGPKLPVIGVWKDIRLEGYSLARLSDVHIRQTHDDDGVTIATDIEAEGWGDGNYQAVLTIIEPDGTTQEIKQPLMNFNNGEYPFATIEARISDPELWWPNGYNDDERGQKIGLQPLYYVQVVLMAGDQLLDQREYSIGLRTIELVQEPDAWGKSFTFYINGVPIFAKGADWIPSDSFPTRVTRDSLGSLIRSAAQANMNMLRVWGGGYYPEDVFFDLCDQFGILVWQDFMFACGIYPADTDFHENVRIEAIENVRRIRHHASLALWCGNNEMEQGWGDWGWNKPNDPLNQHLKAGYDRMFHHMLREIVEEEDPDTAYWPSSASSNLSFEKPNGQEQGDCHYWDVWHGRKPFSAYRSQFPRFMSEFGFQALPLFKTIQTYANPSDQNMTSYIMEHHQRSGSGNGLMIAQMTDTFRMPKNFESLVYLSLLLQAEGIRYGVEHWRRNRQRVSGTLIWQLNDCWPVASWASIDYFGRWKALHYAAKRFYAPLLLSVEDNGTRMGVHLTNDLLEPADVRVHWRLETVSGEVLKSGDKLVHAISLQDTLVGVYDFTEDVLNEAGLSPTARRLVFICELSSEKHDLTSQTLTTFVPNKHLELQEPDLQTSLSERDGVLTIGVQAASLARFVELSFTGAESVFSDNYFDVPAGSSVSVTVPLPAGWTVDQARAALQVCSLIDSYQ
jgi:beta-mannosidase